MTFKLALGQFQGWCPTLLPTLTPSTGLKICFFTLKFWGQHHLYVDNIHTKFQVQRTHKTKDIEDQLPWGSCEKRVTAANFDTLPRIEEIFFSHEIFGVKTPLC